MADRKFAREIAYDGTMFILDIRRCTSENMAVAIVNIDRWYYRRNDNGCLETNP